MRIVIPVGDLHIGGGCKVLAELANAFVEAGHETEIVIPSTGTTVRYPLNCKLTHIPMLHKSFIPYGDVILPNFFTTFRPAYEAWPNKCVRLSLGFEPLWVTEKQEALWTYSQRVPTIAISSWLDNHIFNHSQRRATVIHPGIDLGIFTTGAKLPKQVKEILYIARPPEGYALKGFNDFAQAMVMLRDKYPQPFNINLVCPGGPVHLPGLPHQIHTPQSEAEMAALYRSADVFVSSSWFEAFSLPPLEAMACGTPVVTTDQGGNMDYCKHMVNSYVTPPHNPAALADGIYNVFTNFTLAHQLAQNGVMTAAQFTKKQYTDKVISTLVSIASQR